MIPALNQKQLAELRVLCEEWGIEKLEVFGSAVRGELRPDSDLDLLVTFVGGRERDAFALMDLKDTLSRTVGRKVDLLTRRGVERSRNPWRREEILGRAEVLVGP